MEAAVSEADFIHARSGKAAVKDASAGVGTTRDIGDTPQREITGLHISRPANRAKVRGS